MLRYQTIDPHLFISNREKLIKYLKPNALAVLNANDIMPTNADGVMPFRQNNDLFYLSGIDQEETKLIIYPDAPKNEWKEMLFVKRTSEHIAIWEGQKYTQEEAQATSAISAVYWLDEFEAIFNILMTQVEVVYLNSNEHLRADNSVETRDARFINWCKHRYPLHTYERLAPIMCQLRMIKSEAEIALIRHACAITEKGFRRILGKVKPGMMEYEIEAELIHEMIINRSRGFAYAPIMASGANACVLHYTNNNQVCQEGATILADFGAEYANYCSDLTRVIPVSGRFTARQRAVYNAVLRIMEAAKEILLPGNDLVNYQQTLCSLVEKELVDLGLLSLVDIRKQDPKQPAYKKYFMHGVSHHLGLDVHDVFSACHTFQSGMVLTVEPGIYIREESLGIRLENNVVIRENGVEDLMATIPLAIEEIEALMQPRSAPAAPTLSAHLLLPSTINTHYLSMAKVGSRQLAVINRNYLVIYAFLLTTLIIGVWSGRRKQSITEYAVANRRFGTGALVLTFLATNLAGGSVLNVVPWMASDGVIAMASLSALVISYITIALFIAPKIVYFQQCLTIGDLMESLYDKKSKVIIGVFGTLTTISLIGMELILLGFISETLLGIQASWAIVIGGLLLAMYTAYGGSRSVTATDVFQLIIFVVIFPAVVWIALNKAGGYTQVVTQLPAGKLKIMGHPDFARYLILFITWLLPTGMTDPSLMQRMLMIKTAKQARDQYLIIAAFDPFFQGMLLLFSFAALILFPSLEGDQMVPHVIHSILPVGIRGLAVVSLLAMCMSSISAYLHAAGLTLTRDVIKPYLEKKGYIFDQVRWARYVTVVISMVAIVVGLRSNNPFELLLDSLAFGDGMFMFPLFAGIMGLKTDTRSFYVAMVVTIFTFILCTFFIFPGQSHYTLLATLLANGVTFFSVHVFKNSGFAVVHRELGEESAWRPSKQGIPTMLKHLMAVPEKLVGYSQKKVDQYGASYVASSTLIMLYYTLSFFLWDGVVDQCQTMMIWIRMIGGVLCALLIAKSRWPIRWLGYMPFFWHSTLLICLPLTHTMMYLATQGSVEWMVSFTGMVIFLFVVLDWITALLLLIVGIPLATGIFMAAGGNLDFTLDFTGKYILFSQAAFGIATGLFVARKKQEYVDQLTSTNKALAVIQEEDKAALLEGFKEKIRLLNTLQAAGRQDLNRMIMLTRTLQHQAQAGGTGIALESILAKLNAVMVPMAFSLERMASRATDYLHLDIRPLSVEKLLEGLYGRIPYGVELRIQAKNQRSILVCDPQRIAQLLVNSINTLMSYNLPEVSPVLYVKLQDTQLTYHLPLGGQGKLYKKSIAAMAITLSRWPIVAPMSLDYEVQLHGTRGLVPENSKEILIATNRRIVKAHYGHTNVNIKENKSIMTQLYVFPVDIREIRPHELDVPCRKWDVAPIRANDQYPGAQEQEAIFLLAVQQRSSANLDKIKMVLEMIKWCHGAKNRPTGEPFYLHRLAVAHILLEFNQEEATIIGALVHDAIEDTTLLVASMEMMFGTDVLNVVGDVAHVVGDKERFCGIKFSTEESMFMRLEVGDKRWIYVKIADRMHHIRTIYNYPHVKRKQIANETLQFFVPLARNLGLDKVAEELQARSVVVLREEDTLIKPLSMRAYVFPGQGSQFVGMGKELYTHHAKAKSLFELANQLLGFSITEAMFEGTEDQLQRTDIAQPAIFIHSVIAATVAADFQPGMVAGHSLGEFSALVASGVLDFEAGLKLVITRALAMQKACDKNPGAMAAVIGLDDEVVASVCQTIDECVAPANYNSPGQLVISGTVTGITLACEALQAAGAKKVIRLKVSGAFHSPLMEPARQELAEAITKTPFKKGICPIYQNVTACPTESPSEIKEQLLQQLTSPIRWTQSIQHMVREGATEFIECGPGKVLQGLVKKINPTVNTAMPFMQAFDAVFEKQGVAIDYEWLMDQLWEFYQHPIDLNHASSDELKQLHILSSSQIANLLEHIARNGALVSKYELQTISGFDQETISCLLPFVDIKEIYPALIPEGTPDQCVASAVGYWLSRYERVLEQQQGYQDKGQVGGAPYGGSPDKVTIRLRWQGGNGCRFGMAVRKYAGEAFSWDPATERYGFNLCSVYFILENRKWLKKLIVGNYQVGYGQGVIVNAGFHMDHSGETLMISRASNVGIKPYSSFNGSSLRGTAITCQWGNIEQSCYYAYNSLDGKVTYDQEGNACYAKRIQRSGLYRTTQEVARKGQVGEHRVGGTFVFRPDRQVELGINAVHSHYEVPIRPDLKTPSYDFSGSNHYHLGFFYRYLWHNLHFFGEHALSQGAGHAHVVGVVTSLSSRVDAAALFRHYAPNFHSFYGDAFRENASENSNEQGMYLSVRMYPIKRLQLSAYYDYFRTLQPSVMVAQSAAGYRWLIKVVYQLDQTHLWRVQYKELHKSKNRPQQGSGYQKTVPEIAPYTKRQCKTQWRKQFNQSIGLHSEIQASTYHFLDQSTWGYGVAQRMTWQHKVLKLIGQVSWFDTDTHNPLYFGEKTISHSQAFFGVNKMGFKAYLLVGYRLSVHWRMEAKHSVTWYIGANHLGSGHEKIEGSTKNILSMQLIYKF
eukprot:gene2991-3734_t